MIKYVNFYITENDIILMCKILELIKKDKNIKQYDLQCFFRLTKDMQEAIMENEEIT